MKKIFIKLLILILIIQTSFNLIDIMFHFSKAVNKIYVAEGGTYTFTANSNTYTLGNSSIASVSVGTPYSYKAACLGTNSNYDGEEKTLEDCLYTFTQDSNKYYITNNNMYLYLGRRTSGGVYTYYINSTSKARINVTTSNDGFYFERGGIYLNFNTNGYITSVGSSSQKSLFYLYRQIQSGETSSTELPGYIRATSITSGTKYLIVANNGNNYYLVYPSTSTSNNYAQTAKVKTISGVDYTVTGNSVGTTTLTIDGETYEITVFEENTILEPDSNFIDKALTIGLNSTYKIETNTNGLVWTSNDTNIATVSSNGTVTPVAIGETTLIANLNGVRYEFRVRVINGASSGVQINVLIDTDDDTISYHGRNYESDIYELVDGERVYYKMSSNSYRAVNFFGKPKNGYVLSHVYLSSGYSAITEDTPTEAANGNSTNIINLQVTNLGAATVSGGLTRVLGMGVEGLIGFNRTANSSAKIEETVQFRSEPLSADISQTIYSVNGNTYQSGDRVNAGDTIIYKVTVSKTSNDEKLVIYDGTLTNSLSGAVFIGTTPTGTGNNASQNVTINSTQSTSQTYYVKYVVPNPVPSTISNTVSFAYSTYADEALKTASYMIERPTLSDTVSINTDGSGNKTYITISKEIAGNMRDTDKYFKFLITINGIAGDTYRIAGQDSTVSYNNNSVNTNSTYTVGSTNYIYLKGGQTATIGLASDGTTKQIPVGITYSIVEQDALDYETAITGIQGSTKTTGSLTTQASNNTVEFLNSKDAAALTGAYIEITAYLILFLTGVVLLILIKNRYIINRK